MLTERFTGRIGKFGRLTREDTDPTSPITTRGDVIRGDASGLEERLAKGAEGQFLKMNATDPVWSALTPDFESTEQTVALDTQLDVAHSLGAKPTFVQAFMRCTTANLGFGVGDEIFLSHLGGHLNTPDEGVTLFVDTTNVSLVQGLQIRLIDPATLNNALVTPGSWRWVVRAWK